MRRVRRSRGPHLLAVEHVAAVDRRRPRLHHPGDIGAAVGLAQRRTTRSPRRASPPRARRGAPAPSTCRGSASRCTASRTSRPRWWGRRRAPRRPRSDRARRRYRRSPRARRPRGDPAHRVRGGARGRTPTPRRGRRTGSGGDSRASSCRSVSRRARRSSVSPSGSAASPTASVMSMVIASLMSFASSPGLGPSAHTVTRRRRS